jgi:hypothetical protein
MWLIIGRLTPESLASWLWDRPRSSRSALRLATSVLENCSDCPKLTACKLEHHRLNRDVTIGTQRVFFEVMTKAAIIFGLLSILVGVTAGETVTLVDDPFTDGQIGPSENDDPLGLIWKTSGGALVLKDDQTGIGTGMALEFTPGKAYAHVLSSFPEVLLDTAEDQFSISFDFRLPNGAGSFGAGFRYGIYYSARTLQSAEIQGGAYSDDVGYGVATNAGSNGGNDSGWYRETAGNGILGGDPPSNIAPIPGGGPGIVPDQLKHTATLTVKRGVEGILSLDLTIDEKLICQASQTTAETLTYRFDEFAIGFAAEGNLPTLLIDNFRVTAITATPLESAPKPKPAEAPTGPVYRKWTNKEGREIEAAFVDFNVKTRMLKIALRDGKEFTLPIGSLSAPDIAFATTASSSLVVATKEVAVTPLEVTDARKFKSPSGRDVVRALSKSHPRLIYSLDEWAALKGRVASDPNHQQLYKNVQEVAENLLVTPPLTYRMLGPEKSLLDTSREAVLRIYALGIMKFIDGDTKWTVRAKSELAALALFPDWNPVHFLDTAEMTHAVAVGLDWFHDDLSATERSDLVQVKWGRKRSQPRSVFIEAAGGRLS